MNRTFKQLTAEQRYQIATLLSKQFSQKQIARYIGKSESCVSREISRNKMYSGKYDAANAHQYAVFRHQTKQKHTNFTSSVQFQVDHLLGQGLSPEQISCRLTLEGKPMVSHESISGRTKNKAVSYTNILLASKEAEKSVGIRQHTGDK